MARERLRVEPHIGRQGHRDDVVQPLVRARRAAERDMRHVVAAADDALADEEAEREIEVVPGRAHGDGDALFHALAIVVVGEAHFHRLFDGHQIGVFAHAEAAPPAPPVTVAAHADAHVLRLRFVARNDPRRRPLDRSVVHGGRRGQPAPSMTSTGSASSCALARAA